MQDRAAHHRRIRKTRDRSRIMVIIGAVLLLPPVSEIFHIDGKIGGIPFTLVYLFAVWALLIAGAAALARSLPDDDPGQENGDDAG